MKADIKNMRENMNAKAHRKEKHFAYSYEVVGVREDATIDKMASCRLYLTDRAAYCCLWVHADAGYAAGSGRATGYGYDRPSAAVSEAFAAAKIVLSENIDGRGDSAVLDAMQALAYALDKGRYFTTTVIKAHG